MTKDEAVAQMFASRAKVLEGESAGITKREAFAMAAMQGLLANDDDVALSYVRSRIGLLADAPYDPAIHWPQYIAKCAVEHADALLVELAKERP